MSRVDLKKNRIFRLFKRIKDPQIQTLRQQNLKLIRENHRLHKRVNSLGEELGIFRQELKRLQLLIKEYQQMLFKKKALKGFKKDKDDNDKYGTPKTKGAPKG